MDDPHTQHIPTGGRQYRVRLPSPIRRVHLLEPASLPPVATENVPGGTRPPAERAAEDAGAILQALSSIQQSLIELEDRRRQSLDELQQVAIEMSVAIASRVLRQHVDAGEMGIEPLVTEAVERFGATPSLTIRLNPQDLEQLQRVRAEAKPDAAPELAATFVADASVARGDCEIQNENHSYVARMELILEEIRVDLMESLEDAQIERRRAAAAGSGLRRFPDRRETA